MLTQSEIELLQKDKLDSFNTIKKIFELMDSNDAIRKITDFAADKKTKTNFSFLNSMKNSSTEIESYWNEIKNLNSENHEFKESELIMEVNGERNFIDVLTEIFEAVNRIEDLLNTLEKSDERLFDDFSNLLTKKEIDAKIFDDIPYYENPFINRNFEKHNLEKPNLLKKLRIDLTVAKIKYFEEYLKTNKNDLLATKEFEESKSILKQYARTALHVD